MYIPFVQVHKYFATKYSNFSINKLKSLRRKYLFYCSYVSNTTMNEKMEDMAPISEGNPLNTEGIIIDKRPFTAITEGQATVDFPSSLDVFYNPVQEFNRDLSIAVLRLYASDFQLAKEAFLSKRNSPSSKHLKLKEDDFANTSENFKLLPPGHKNVTGIRILEALAASGLRSIRYAKEVGGVKEIVANDISKAAIECMNTNLTKNEVLHLVTPSHNDASLLMYENRHLEKRFEVIDLDPYGSPHMFLDGAVQCIADGGLLLVTCTDMAVLCGNSPETCNLKYGSLSMKHKACHEMALRITLQCIESNANKYGRYIVPLLSLSADFYCRVFVRVFTSQVKCKESFTKLSWVHQCTSCESTTFQQLGHVVRNGNSTKYQLGSPPIGPTCTHCGGIHQTAGPIWTAPIHDQAFVSRLRKSLEYGGSLGTLRRIEGTLALIEEELPDVALYLVLDKLFSVLRMSSCRTKEFASALLNSGWKVSSTHAHKNGIKTDAPMEFIWEIMRAREKLFPINTDLLPSYHPARAILRGEKKVCNENKVIRKIRTVRYATTEITSHHKSTNNSNVERVTDPTMINSTPAIKESAHTVLSDPVNRELGLVDIPKIDFTLHPDAESESRKLKLLRFQINPEKNWGPKMRATTSLFHGDLQDKSKNKQGKRKLKAKYLESKQFKKKSECANNTKLEDTGTNIIDQNVDKK